MVAAGSPCPMRASWFAGARWGSDSVGLITSSVSRLCRARRLLVSRLTTRDRSDRPRTCGSNCSLSASRPLGSASSSHERPSTLSHLHHDVCTRNVTRAQRFLSRPRVVEASLDFRWTLVGVSMEFRWSDALTSRSAIGASTRSVRILFREFLHRFWQHIRFPHGSSVGVRMDSRPSFVVGGCQRAPHGLVDVDRRRIRNSR
jgi:hypothetical protein